MPVNLPMAVTLPLCKHVKVLRDALHLGQGVIQMQAKSVKELLLALDDWFACGCQRASRAVKYMVPTFELYILLYTLENGLLPILSCQPECYVASPNL